MMQWRAGRHQAGRGGWECGRGQVRKGRAVSAGSRLGREGGGGQAGELGKVGKGRHQAGQVGEGRCQAREGEGSDGVGGKGRGWQTSGKVGKGRGERKAQVAREMS